MIEKEEILGAIARGWCSEDNERKQMDPDLALAIAEEIYKLIHIDIVKENKIASILTRFELLDL